MDLNNAILGAYVGARLARRLKPVNPILLSLEQLRTIQFGKFARGGSIPSKATPPEMLRVVKRG